MLSKQNMIGLVVAIPLILFISSLLYHQRPGSPWNVYKNQVMVKWQGNDGELAIGVFSRTGYLYAREPVDIGDTFVYKQQRYRAVGYEGKHSDRFVYLLQADTE